MTPDFEREMTIGDEQIWSNEATTPGQNDLLLAQLEGWMRDHIDGFHGPLAAEQFEGGQSNPTYRLFSGDSSYVLRRKPLGHLLPSAHAVDREYRVMLALARTAVPVPKVFALCEDDAVIGSAFYVMEFLDGRIFWDPRLRGLAPDVRRAMFDSMNTVIAALHCVDHTAVGLAEFGRPGSYLARQIRRWSRQYQASEIEPQPAMDQLIAWLPHHLPPEHEPRIVHGDYRIDNLIYHATEPRVIGVLDWELSTIGDPLADFAYHAMAWRVTPELFRGLDGIDLAALGIPTEDEYVAAYCERTGRSRGFGLGVLHGLQLVPSGGDHAGDRKRVVDGTAASREAEELGRLARPVGEQAWALARSLGA